MRRDFLRFSASLPLALLLGVCPLWSRPLTGMLTLKLTSPLTKEIRDQAERIVRDSLMNDLVSWVGETTDKVPDTSNPVIRYHLSTLLDSCIRRGSKDPRLDGRAWSLAITVPSDSVQNVLRRHNQEHESLSVAMRQISQEALEGGTYLGSYIAAMGSAFHYWARFVPKHQMRTEDLAFARSLLRKITVHSDEMVITGKPGSTPRNGTVLRMTVDSLPVPGIALRCYLPDGRTILKGRTSAGGELSFNEMSIPFVPKGTFLYVSPDIGATINAPIVFGPRHLGLPDMEYVMIFNVIPPIYALTYSFQSVSGIDASAHELSKSAFLEKFLADSCFMKPRTGSDLADLVLEVECQLSNRSHDNGEDALKVEAKIAIQPLRQGTRIEKVITVHEQTYTRGATPPIGLFLWESGKRLRKSVKDALFEM